MAHRLIWIRVYLLVTVLCAISIPAYGQSPSVAIKEVRNPEVFVHVGVFGAGSDEGRGPSGLSVGGAATFPWRGGFAIDLDVQTARVERTLGRLDRFYESRRTLLIPSIQYRLGRRSAYAFVGAGIGLEFARSIYSGVGVAEKRISEVERKVSVRGGFAMFSRRRIGLRADAFMAGWHLGARLALGYRFGA